MSRILRLTPRERDVLQVIGMGRLTDQELVQELGVSVYTVRSHVKSLLKKADLRRRGDLLALALLVDRTEQRTHPKR